MIKPLFLVISLLVLGQSSHAQTYFQQEVNYKISVALDDQNHVLRGHESFEYINNSNAVLDRIYIHLWPNAYKNKHTALAKQLARNRNYLLYSTLQENKGYIDSLDFQVNNQTVKWNLTEENIDIGVILLNTPLQPGEKCTVSTPFKVKLPSGLVSRMGHIGQSYQITQWYPKPAVFDKDGWHAIPYLNQGEFYSEYGSFDVSITLPSNYVVGATGNLETQSEIDFLNQLAQDTSRYNRLSALTVDGNEIASSSSVKTIRYTQRNVHDFGWFADKKWIVKKGEVTTPHTKTKVTCWAMCTPGNNQAWEKATEYLQDAIYYYSLWNGDYPYTQVTAVDGTISAGGGMEYPNVTVIGNTSGGKQLETVIMHEVGHNWFYGILGSNERDFAWMDEGINSFNEDRYMLTKYANEEKTNASVDINGLKTIKLAGSLNTHKISYLTYALTAKSYTDQPLNCNSDCFTSLNYGANVYKKTAVIFYYLQSYLGPELFDKCMQRYFSEWKFKHPQPADLRRVFEYTTGQDLSWFFDDLISTNERLDFAITSVRSKKNKSTEEVTYTVQVMNTGSAAGPCNVSAFDNKNNEKTALASRWTEVIDPGKKASVSFTAQPNNPNFQDQKLNLFQLNENLEIPEISLKNNSFRKGSIAPRTEPVTLRFFSGLENGKNSQLFYIPIAAWNQYDRWMPGIVIHNYTLPGNRFTWWAAPLYSIHQKQLNGIGAIGYNLEHIEFGTKWKQFNSYDDYDLDGNHNQEFYRWIQPYLELRTKGDPKLWNRKFSLRLRASYSHIDLYSSTRFSNNNTLVSNSTQKNFLSLTSELKTKFGLRQSLRLKVDYTTDMQSGNNQHYSEAEYEWNYQPTKMNRTVSLKIFHGLSGNKTISGWNPNGMTGAYNYTYSQLYSGRNDNSGISSRQFNDGQGYLHAQQVNENYTPLQFNHRLLSGQVNFTLPIQVPISLFVSGALGYEKREVANETKINRTDMWTAGVCFPVIKNIFEIYVPLAYSDNIKIRLENTPNKYPVVAMFKCDLTQLNPNKIANLIQ